ncbi:hypothetical protein FPSE_03082 [Fusarium pseudograminearum CS3096]|uniref:Uncharacterized protein n=1 Tax=Fusarium pseudograminearum (strain CS3096) TaxID=1028729 RepID=K3UW78_FUSPC|nr:hypothetical protein FPSE_03082 [Fusarium pseudograminearum CS3096]EKJ76896.1 hypothetical protein FPSE_03082 [Fusarium pseudograminearum CS3096]
MAEEPKTCPSFDSRMICKSRAKDSCCATAGSSYSQVDSVEPQLDGHVRGSLPQSQS